MAYKTLPIELIEIADKAEQHFRGMGFRLSLEPQQVGFPRTPAFVARRGPMTQIVEISSVMDLEVCEDWIFFARSCSRDTRVIFCVPGGQKNFEKITAKALELRLGLYVIFGDRVDVICVPHDLTMTINLPELANLPRPVRVKLGPAYERFERGDWQEGFEEACQALEQVCRRYLAIKVRAGHVRIVDKAGVVKNPTQREIGRMTLGALAVAFGNIQFPTPSTDFVAQTLSAINGDRIGVVHRKRQRKTEERLRRNVNANMWKIIDCFRKFPS